MLACGKAGKRRDRDLERTTQKPGWRHGSVRFVLKQEGNRISGTAGPVDEKNPGQVYDGKLDGNHLMFASDDTAKDGSGLSLTYNFDLTITGDHMQGKAHGHSGNRSWTLDISLTRQK